MFDYFVGRLRCLKCGAVSDPDGKTNIQTSLRPAPDLAYLGVGHALEIDAARMAGAGYLALRPHRAGEPCRILQTWSCPACQEGFNWARILVERGAIAEVAAAALTRAELDQAHYLSEEDARNLAARLTGRPSVEFSALPAVAILRERLPPT